MSQCYYRLSDTTDPEERLEDAALSKALHDKLGSRLTILRPDQAPPDHGLHLGRTRGAQDMNPRGLSPSNIAYWEDPAFIRLTNRDWGHYDLEAAMGRVEELHASGRDAVVKSTLSAKHMVMPVRRGNGLAEVLDAMIYSFIDRGPCLLVQEAVPMRYERRFLVLNRELVTQSAVGTHLTPLSRLIEPGPGQAFEDLHLLTPNAREMVHLPGLTERMQHMARRIAETSGFDHLCVDLCLIGEDPERGLIEPIEYNPMQPGMLGLYGCDPYRIAEGVRAHLDANPELYATVPVMSDTPEKNMRVTHVSETENFDQDWMEFDG